MVLTVASEVSKAKASSVHILAPRVIEFEVVVGEHAGHREDHQDIDRQQSPLQVGPGASILRAASDSPQRHVATPAH